MNPYLIFIFIVGFNSIFAKEFPFNYERLGTDFNGVISNQNSILVYGNGSIILRSTDMGNSWQQIMAAHDSLDILKIKSINGNYYGILSKNFIIYSRDEGISWEMKFIDDDLKLFDLDVDNENLYVHTGNKIYAFDFDLNLEHTFSLDSSWKSTKLLLNSDKIYLNADSGKIVVLNKYSGEIFNIINFKQLGLCDSCNKPPSKIISDNSNIYTVTDKGILWRNDLDNKWDIIYDSSRTFWVYNGNIYIIKAEKFETPSGLFLYNAMLSLYRIENKKEIKITVDEYKRYTVMLIPNEIYFINKDTMIIVGNEKLISISYNGGLTWNLKCNFGREPIYWLNELTGYSVGNDALLANRFGQIFKTTDGGTTFLPQLFTDTSFTLFSNPNLFFIDTSGYGIVYKAQTLADTKNVMITRDFGNTYKSMYISDFYGNFVKGKSNIIKNDSLYYIFINKSFNNIPMNIHRNYTEVFIFDKQFNYISKLLIDSLWVSEIIYYKNQLIGIGRDWKYPLYLDDKDSNQVYYIMHSNDFGKNWIYDMKLEMKDTAIYNLIEVDNQLYFTGNVLYRKQDIYLIYKTLIYNLNLDLNQRKIIFADTMFPGGLIKFNNTYYVGNWGYVSSNQNSILEPDNWEIIPFPDYSLHLTNINDSTIYASATNLKNYTANVLKLTPKSTTFIEVRTETPTQFWAYPPYPQPAKNYIKSIIYWDQRYDIKDAKIIVYNIYGEKIEGKDHVSIEIQQPWQGVLIWNCNAVPNGIYFVVIHHGDATRSIPVVVDK